MKRGRVTSVMLSVALAGAAATGCGGKVTTSSADCPDGAEGCPCSVVNTCNSGLTCASGVCVAGPLGAEDALLREGQGWSLSQK